MQLGEGVEWALHSCTLLASVPPGRALSAAKLAEFHQVPPAYLAKHLQALAQAGIVESTPGRRGGYRLAKPPHLISLLDVVEAVDGGRSTFECTEIRRRGPAAVPARYYRAPCAIHAAMDRADAAWRAELERQTIADVLSAMERHINPVSVRRTIDWFADAVR